MRFLTPTPIAMFIEITISFTNGSLVPLWPFTDLSVTNSSFKSEHIGRLVITTDAVLIPEVRSFPSPTLQPWDGDFGLDTKLSHRPHVTPILGSRQLNEA